MAPERYGQSNLWGTIGLAAGNLHQLKAFVPQRRRIASLIFVGKPVLKNFLDTFSPVLVLLRSLNVKAI
jgi:hypothetical protein